MIATPTIGNSTIGTRSSKGRRKITSRLRLKTVNSLFSKESTRTIVVTLQPQGTPTFHFKFTVSSLTNWYYSMFRKCCERLPLVHIILPFDRPCRKPRPGMLLRARDELGLDMHDALFIDDSISDIRAGLWEVLSITPRVAAPGSGSKSNLQSHKPLGLRQGGGWRGESPILQTPGLLPECGISVETPIPREIVNYRSKRWLLGVDFLDVPQGVSEYGMLLLRNANDKIGMIINHHTTQR